MNIDEIISKVKIRLDEMDTLGDDITPGNDTAISEMIEESVPELLELLPLHLCPNKALPTSGAQSHLTNGTGIVPLPDDFVKLAYFKMSEWERPVTKAISVYSQEYSLQQNPYTRGGVSKPVVAIRSDVSNPVLEYYSVKEAHVFSKALYVPRVNATELKTTLISPLVWLVTAKLLDVYREGRSSESAMNRVYDFIKRNSG